MKSTLGFILYCTKNCSTQNTSNAYITHQNIQYDVCCTSCVQRGAIILVQYLQHRVRLLARFAIAELTEYQTQLTSKIVYDSQKTVLYNTRFEVLYGDEVAIVSNKAISTKLSDCANCVD